MRIAYMSDLHLEFEPPDVKSSAWKALVAGRAVLGHPQRGPVLKDIVGADLVVLAGDVDLGLGGIAYADEVSRFVGCPVVYVAGNHEYYGHDLDHLQDGLREAAWKTNGRVLYLERDSVRLWPGGHSLLVHGCTLWTDYGLNGSLAADKALARHGMSDQPQYRLFLPRTCRGGASPQRHLAASGGGGVSSARAGTGAGPAVGGQPSRTAAYRAEETFQGARGRLYVGPGRVGV